MQESRDTVAVADQRRDKSALPPAQQSRASFLRRWLRRVWQLAKLLVLICLILLVAYIVITNMRGTAARRRIAAELARRGLLASVEARKEQITPHDPRDNGARFYKAAFALPPEYAEWQDDLPFLSSARIPKYAEKIHPKLAARLQTFMANQAEVFRLFEQGRRYDQFHYGIDTNDPLDTSMNGYLRGFSRMANYLYLKCLDAQAQGKPTDAIDAIEGLLDLNASFNKEQYKSVALTVIAKDFFAAFMAEDLLSRTVVEQQSISRLRDHLSRRAIAIDLIQGMQYEIALANVVLQNIEIIQIQWIAARRHARRFDVQFISEMMGLPVYKPSPFQTFKEKGFDTWFGICPGWFELQVAKEVEKALVRYDQLKGLGNNPKALLGLLAEQEDAEDPQIGGLAMMLRIWLAHRAKLHAAVAAMSIELYRIRKGHWPERLNDFEASTPKDPFSGDHLHYKSTDDGVTVYSVGRNLVDDGGKDDRLQDITFRLYDPEFRNSKPAVAGRVDNE